MTCGACHPEAFRSKAIPRVIGYAVAKTPGRLALMTQRLHFFGAEYVFSDQPSGQVKHRPGFKAATKVASPGDRIILADDHCLGTKPVASAKVLAVLEGRGFDIQVLKDP